MSETFSPEELTSEHILKWFSYSHLPERLQLASKMFADAAMSMLVMCPTRSAERTVAFRKILEAKDAFVRACLENKP